MLLRLRRRWRRGRWRNGSGFIALRNLNVLGMMEQFLHGRLALLLEPQKCVKRCNQASDKRYIDAEADLHAGELERDFCEDGKRCQDQNRGEPRGSQSDYFSVTALDENRASGQWNDRDQEHKRLKDEDAKADKRRIETQARIRDIVATKPLSSHPGKEQADEAYDRRTVENLLLELKGRQFSKKS